MEYPVEFGATALDRFADSKHFDKIYDTIAGKKKQKQQQKARNTRERDPENARPHRHRNELPAPEGDYDGANDPDLAAESETSERVLRAYENERDDPKRKPSASLVGSVRSKRDSGAMSYANGYGRTERPASQPPRGRYYEDDDYESDYDERTGRKYRATGRGYDAERDRDFDREIVETERYRGPARDYDPRRQNHFNDPYAPAPYNPAYAAPAAAGAVAPYRRSQADLATRRSKSRGRRDRSRSYSRSYSRSRSRSRSRGEGLRGKFDEAFDTSLQGAGVAIAGALVGGYAGRELGGGRKNQKRDMLIGAVVGGLGANAAENQWREYQNRRKEGGGEYDDRYYDRRSRSNIRN